VTPKYFKTKNQPYRMKSIFYSLCALILIASCSSPKYAYNFDHYNYQSAKKNKVASVEQTSLPALQPELLVASNDDSFVPVAEPTKEELETTVSEVRKTYLQMDKSERKEFRKDVKNFIKEKKESIKAVKKTNAMDNDLKLAAIFGAVGIVALIISGDVFYIIGGIALIIGVVFFVKWLVRQ